MEVTHPPAPSVHQAWLLLTAFLTTLGPTAHTPGPAQAGWIFGLGGPPFLLFDMEPAPQGDSSPQLKYELIKALDQAQEPELLLGGR